MMNNPYPPWWSPYQGYAVPPPTSPTDMSPKQFKQWMRLHKEWEDLMGGKKDTKKDDKTKERTFNMIEVLIILLAVSPFIALAYKPFLLAIMR